MGGLKYVVAKYVPDLFRQEPRNVGVFVTDGERAVARLVGQTHTGDLDLRTARIVGTHSTLYAEWFDHWMRATQQLGNGRRADIQELWTELLDDGDMFSVAPGGRYIPDELDTPLEEIAEKLYRKLVSPREKERTDGQKRRTKLYGDIRRTFARLGLLEDKRKAEMPGSHLVRVKEPVPGTLPVPHRPSFSQVNGKLTVMEQLDFAVASEERATQHALSTAYMFEDIITQNGLTPVETIVILKSDPDKNRYAQDVGRSALADIPGTQFVNWESERDRNQFLRGRLEAAGIH